jgi:hypothetical protein
MRRTLMLRLFLLLGLSCWCGFAAAADEDLHLQVTYRGLFSAGSEIPIADLRLRTQRPGGDAKYLETRLDVSSEDYPYVEAFYPIRYRFRSWYPDDRSAVFASEYFEQNNHKAGKHRLIDLDAPGGGVKAHDLKAGADRELPALLSGDYRITGPLAQRFDRLGLLQHLRTARLAIGDRLELPVTDGKRMLTYRVSVEARERVRAAGREWPAIKLRFDGLRTDRQGNVKHTHRPVFIWLSDDIRRLPLKAVSRHTLGRFSITLQGPVEPPAQLASTAGPGQSLDLGSSSSKRR